MPTNFHAKLDNKFCISPWTEIKVDQQGDITYCCQSQEYIGNIKDITLAQAFDSAEYQSFRNDTLTNKWHAGCEQCVNSEKKSKHSMRFTNQNIYDDFVLRSRFKQVDQDNPLLQKLILDFSNACNLRCTMCGPFRSTGWIGDLTYLKQHMSDDEINDIVKVPDNLSMSISEDFVDKNLDTILSIQKIMISGGEPFYHKQFLYLLKKLNEYNYKGSLSVITNATLIKQEYIDQMKNLNIGFVISADGINHLYEYIRPSNPFGKYKWNEVKHTIEQIKKNFHVSISYTPQLLNLYNIKEYIEYTQDANISNIFNYPLSGPKYLSLTVHPDVEYKQHLADYLEQNYITINNVRPIINVLRCERTQEDDDLWKLFCKTINLLDTHRNTNILNYMPSIRKFMIK